MSVLLSIWPAILSLVSRALALVLSMPRSTLAPTVSLSRAASALSSAFLSPLTLALTLSLASVVFSLTVSLASTALSLSVLSLGSALMAGMALRLMPSATARAAVASLYMAGPPRRRYGCKTDTIGRDAVRPSTAPLQSFSH